jgi:hypothetical protein
MTATRRRILPLTAQLVVVLLACAVAGFFTFVKPNGTSLVQRFTPATLGDEPPGAVVLGQESGKLAVGIAAAPRVHGLLVVLTVFGANGTGQAGLRPKLTITDSDGSTTTALAGGCSTGCYEAVFPTTELPRSARVTFSNGDHAAFTFPANGPSARGLKLVHEAEAEYKQIHSMVTHERLGSSPTQVTDTTYYSVAPHRLRFLVKGEDESIIIGRHRWDRNLGGPWRESQQSVITPIAAYWTPLVKDATVLGSSTVGGRPVWVISFADPQTPGFFTIWLDKQNHRTLKLQMTAAAHFMHHVYTDFNAPLKVVPPKLTVTASSKG